MKQETFLLLLILLFLSGFVTGCNNSPPNTPTQSVRPVFVQTLSLSGGIEEKTFNGVIQSAITSNIAFRVPGTVESVPVIVGQSVKAGEVLATLDPHDYEVIVVELEARQEEAKAENTFAQAEFDRVNQASKNNAISKVSLDRATATLARTSASLRVMEQNLIKAKDALRYTVLKAPFAGIVGDLTIEDFEQVLPAIPVIELHNPNMLEAVIDVPENQVARFKKGQPATIHWYGSEEKHSATVSEISTVPNLIKQTFDVTFSLNEKSVGILPGKSVTVSAPLATEQDAEYCVPFSAVLQIEKDSFVFLTSEQTRRVSKKPVTIKRITEDGLCIEGELEPEQIIVTAGVHYLSDGQEVGQFLNNN